LKAWAESIGQRNHKGIEVIVYPGSIIWVYSQVI